MKKIVIDAIKKTKGGWRSEYIKKLKTQYPELYSQLVFLEEQINAKIVEGASEDEIKLLVNRWIELIESIKEKIK